ncbi:uncharacterized protein LOC125652172 [Ostrea edulis]|uniref:uncharacterized protein LOC125652172 n=1 Tax=Ostrea edulis TaxID=37623 RepID=UPI00209487E9|nr:uncharacterized protein LOC125652172 [Ostrea edulis]XP_048737129.1 uncharacterized protein LOC125652172 [Ostrea edulis]XP_056021508.1 uncharacterized protein LOC125652172 [Ostrea edulis]
MNIASDVYHAVIRPFQSQQSRSGVTNQQSGELEREEDGFLLVAETESEKTTLYASNFTGDSPPDYNQAQMQQTQSQPLSYMEYNMQWNGNQTPQNESPMDYNTIPLTSHSDISGVTFKIAPQLQVMFDLHESASSRGHSLQRQERDGSRFCYDFSLEDKVLRDAQFIASM